MYVCVCNFVPLRPTKLARDRTYVDVLLHGVVAITANLHHFQFWCKVVASKRMK